MSFGINMKTIFLFLSHLVSYTSLIVHFPHSSLTIRRVCKMNIRNRFSLLSTSSAQVPVVDKKIAKVTSKFYGMVDRFESYTDEEIFTLENDRLKHLVYGGKEALQETKVVTAFCILYEDILPVRFGGDILFNLLEKAINNGRKKGLKLQKKAIRSNIINDNNLNSNKKLSMTQRKVINDVMQFALSQCLLECNVDEIEQQNNNSQSNIAFANLFSEIDKNNDNKITIDEFESWIQSIIITESEEEEESMQSNQTNKEIIERNEDVLSSIDTRDVFHEADMNQDGILSREEFRLWTTGLKIDCCDPDNPPSFSSSPSSPTNSDTIISSQVSSESSFSSHISLTDIPLSSPSAASYRERYLDMVQSFAKWGKQLNKISSTSLPSDMNTSTNQITDNISTDKDSRLNLIVSGCFAGAENPGVVKALGILYEDYLPLRMAGDIVFKLVKTKMNSVFKNA
mmetsp:Transcript_9633/g.9696  ORF Transcript_9633/g.9696 Transcript_9633/m.9696 type:complete len:456 (-) Transcript_9633:255-1622(-)